MIPENRKTERQLSRFITQHSALLGVPGDDAGSGGSNDDDDDFVVAVLLILVSIVVGISRRDELSTNKSLPSTVTAATEREREREREMTERNFDREKRSS